MVRARLNRWAKRVKLELRRAFAEKHSSREVAGSFALGVFITMLPTLGVGVLVFLVLAWIFERISKVALFASVLVFNPVVKWGVYASSFALGVFLLGPVDGARPTTISFSLDAANDVLLRLLVGNLILAIAAAIPSYVICYRLVEAFRAKELDVVEQIEEIVGPDAESGGADSAAEDATGSAAEDATDSANEDGMGSPAEDATDSANEDGMGSPADDGMGSIDN